MMPVSLVAGLMLVGYVLVMGYLAVGVWILRRQAVSPPSGQAAGRPAARRAPRSVRVARPSRSRRKKGRIGRGWPGLVAHLLGTATGGYLVLMAVVVGYDRVVGRLGRGFLASAFTGCALLIGIALPVFLVASWLERRVQGARKR